MKSGKQRRKEILVQRAAKAELAKEKRRRAALDRRNARLEGEVLVDVTRLRATASYSLPEFVTRGFYIDHPFSCKDCGKPQVWTATQQKWWYEIAQGDAASVAIRCRPCRKRQQALAAKARAVHVEGLTRKAQRQKRAGKTA